MWKLIGLASRYAVRSVFATCAVALALVAQAGRCDAGFTVRITPGTATVTAGGAPVDFTIWLDADNEILNKDIYGFTIRLELRDSETGGAPPIGIGFTGGQTPSSDYLFDGNTFFNGPDVSLTDLAGNPSGSPSQAITFIDLPLNDPYYITVSGVQSWKLGIATVEASAFASGSFTINFGYSSLDGENSAPLDATFESSGKFSIEGSGNVTPVPAPPAVVMALTGCVGLLAGRLRRRTAAN